MKKSAMALALILLVLTWGCSKESGTNPDIEDGGGTPPPERSIFVEGCPIAGKSIAKPITNPLFEVQGPDGLGSAGDYLLMNEHAAFVVQGTTHVNTYYYYGGIPIDAVALSGCAQAGPERFEEMMMMVGSLNINSISSSYLRAFKGESVEVLNDGSDGQAAVVRIHGTDDTFWLTELELLLMFLKMGEPAPPSAPQNFDIFVDYILPPDSPVMRIEFNVRNTGNEQNSILTGLANFFGDTTTVRYPAQANYGVPSIGMTLDMSVQWIVASRGDGAWAVAMKDANMSTVHISGVDAVLDVDKVTGAPIELAPSGQPGDSAKITYFLSVGPGDYNTAIVPLATANPGPLNGMTYQLEPLKGIAYDAQNGYPVENALIQIQYQNSTGNWVFMDGFFSDKDGHFGGYIPKFDVENYQYRMMASADGRVDAESVYFYAGDIREVNAVFQPAGRLRWEIHDDSGQLIPAKILLWQGGQIKNHCYSASGVGVGDVAPGAYDVTVTRGTEYTTSHRSIIVPSNGGYRLNVTLDHVVDTTGYMCSDNHVHAAPSGDNKISIEERIRSVAAEGLDVVVSTDHDIVVSWQFGIDQNNLGDQVAYVQGEEVTESIPGHNNIYPIQPWPDVNARGGPVQWWNSQIDSCCAMDLAELFAAERARGAQIIQVNHPRSGVFSAIAYDRMTGAATEPPASIGMRPGAVLWDLGFDVYELMNGITSPFMNPSDPRYTGNFEDWMSLLNLGHPKTVLGNSDVHDWDMPAYPRNYFPTSSDSPRDFNVDEMIDAIKKGNVLISMGAFARIEANTTFEMGDTVAGPVDHVNLHVHIEGIPEIDVTHFKVFVNCDQFLDVPTTDPNAVVKYDGVVVISKSQDYHIEVLGFGVNNLPQGLIQFDSSAEPRFVSNAIFVDADGGGYTPPGGKTCAYTLP